MKGCPHCGDVGIKAIYMGLPVRLCVYYSCGGIWGIGAYMFEMFPISDGENFSFAVYEGSYWRALWAWIKGDFAE